MLPLSSKQIYIDTFLFYSVGARMPCIIVNYHEQQQLSSHYGVSKGYFPLEQRTLRSLYEPVLQGIRVTFSLHVFLCQRNICHYT